MAKKQSSKVKFDAFLQKALTVHGTKYDYSSVEYVGSNNQITIICPVHGKFSQTPSGHIYGYGCKLCANVAHTVTNETFISRAKNIHNDAFDYSLVKYIKAKIKVDVICNTCHKIFSITPANHLNGNGCSHCRGYNRSTSDFIKLLTIKHNNIYDYSKVNYVEGHTKIDIICKIHGLFSQEASAHLKGQGCSKCSFDRKRIDYSTFISRATKLHETKLNFDNVTYVDTITPIEITCIVCNYTYTTLPSYILNGNGCSKCAVVKQHDGQRKTAYQFITQAIQKHDTLYNYDKVNYIGNKARVTITCPIHGDYDQIAKEHLNGCGCPTCHLKYSRAEKEVFDYISALGFNAIENSRSIIKPREIDLYIPDKKLAIEFNGVFWHSEDHVSKSYHLNKTIDCEKKGIQLIHIYEDEWYYKQSIVKSMISNKLGISGTIVYARKCVVNTVDSKTCTEFLNANHLHGSVSSKYRYGLFYNNELVSLMTFGNSRFKYDGIELHRFCNKLGYSVVGGASKLFKQFTRVHLDVNEIISYADRSWSMGNLYYKIGFKYDSTTVPNYSYVVGDKRINRFKFRKTELIKAGFDASKSEREIMNVRGIYRIYDSGNLKFIWNR